ncbi:MAG TPA: DUF222 domain-containing protein [Acidimicrobiales bacterium]|nr:DUF222 domain-containing protein [Acidimicrobiales bacterium]
MLEELREHLDQLVQYVDALDPRRVTGVEAAALLDLAGDMERLGAGLKLLIAPRAAECARWRDQGHRSAASWLAAVTKSSVGEAVATLETASHLVDLPETAAALRGGALSAVQVKAIAAAASADPSSEGELIEAAGYLSVKGLKERARKVEATAASRISRDTPGAAVEIHKQRYMRFWTDVQGVFRLCGALTPETGAELLSAVRSRATFAADEARRAGITAESQPAYDADALVALAVGDHRTETFAGAAGGRVRSASILLHVSLEALRRGMLEKGETCEIPGVGPVPLGTAENLMGDAITKLVISNGVDVSTVCHLGRTVPIYVRTALEARDPVCVVPACENSLSLEIDHWKIPFAQGGPSELWNLARLCSFHHRLKTYEGFELRGGPGKWEWVPPPL